MSELDRLIQKLCPNGVEFVQLDELLDYEQPTKYIVDNTNYKDSYQTPVLTAGKTFILGYTDEDFGIYPAEKLNPVIIFDDFTTSFHWVNFNFKVKSSALKVISLKEEIDVSFRYVYHAMRSISYDINGHRRRWIRSYSKLRIPLPPIEVQEEIVRILDSFKELEKDLEKEQMLRRKQYEFYRDHLINDQGYDVRALKDIVKLKTGQNITRKYISGNPGKYPVVNSGKGFLGYTDKYNMINEEIGIASRGTVGHISWTEGMYFRGSLNYGVRVLDEQEVNKRYLYYGLKANQKDIYRLSVHTGIPALNMGSLYMLELPIPAYEIQEKIVQKLDYFHTLAYDIDNGLPREIELRQKQYEYYRDKLLNFKELM